MCQERARGWWAVCMLFLGAVSDAAVHEEEGRNLLLEIDRGVEKEGIGVRLFHKRGKTRKGPGSKRRRRGHVLQIARDGEEKKESNVQR